VLDYAIFDSISKCSSYFHPTFRSNFDRPDPTCVTTVCLPARGYLVSRVTPAPSIRCHAAEGALRVAAEIVVAAFAIGRGIVNRT
jgi:hypothetical protein